MKKYLVCTNIWGKRKVTMWLSKDVFDEEREYFDTFEEAKDFVNLFIEYASTFPNPDKKKEGHWKNKDKWTCNYGKSKLAYDTFKPGEMLWGYVIGNTEKCSVVEWGGISMNKISKKDDIRMIKDYLFRGEDEIPKNYIWDEGEYEGWLQFRWGDGKNAIGYVEPIKPEKPKEQDDEVENIKEYFENIEDYDEIENSFLKEEDKEKLKLLSDKW